MRVICVVLAVLFLMSSCSTECLRVDENRIRDRFLEATPQGTPLVKLREIVEKRKYETISESVEYGYWTRKKPKHKYKTYGKGFLRVQVGHYRSLPWRVDVLVVWILDENQNVIDIIVEKEADAL